MSLLSNGVEKIPSKWLRDAPEGKQRLDLDAFRYWVLITVIQHLLSKGQNEPGKYRRMTVFELEDQKEAKKSRKIFRKAEYSPDNKKSKKAKNPSVKKNLINANKKLKLDDLALQKVDSVNTFEDFNPIAAKMEPEYYTIRAKELKDLIALVTKSTAHTCETDFDNSPGRRAIKPAINSLNYAKKQTPTAPLYMLVPVKLEAPDPAFAVKEEEYDEEEEEKESIDIEDIPVKQEEMFEEEPIDAEKDVNKKFQKNLIKVTFNNAKKVIIAELQQRTKQEFPQRDAYIRELTKYKKESVNSITKLTKIWCSRKPFCQWLRLRHKQFLEHEFLDVIEKSKEMTDKALYIEGREILLKKIDAPEKFVDFSTR
jgi:hypothetical protein